MIEYFQDRLERAMRAPDPHEALRALVYNLYREGMYKEEIFGIFIEFLEVMRASKKYSEEEEDTLMSIMDALTGWCHPDAWLEPEDA
jgi:hypothetical protein